MSQVDQGRIDSFIAEARALQAYAVKVEGAERMRKGIVEALKREGCKSIVLGRSKIAEQTRLRNWISGFGIRVEEVDEAKDLKTLLSTADAGIAEAAAGISASGSLLELYDRDEQRLVSVLPPTHIAILPASKLVGTLEEASTYLLEWQRAHGPSAPTSATFITGPSRTADIEQTLILGVHGPHRLYIFIM
jgi:L-lactate utilization protein LutC